MQLPVLGSLDDDDVIDSAVTLVKSIPKYSENIQAEYEQLLQLSVDLGVYGIDLGTWFAPLQSRQ